MSRNNFPNWFTYVPQYPGLQCYFTRFNSCKSHFRQGNFIRAMIRSEAVELTPILENWMDNSKTMKEWVPHNLLLGTLGTSCYLAALVSQHNFSNLSLRARNNSLEVIVTDTECISITENNKVHKGELTTSVGNWIPSVTSTKDLYIPASMEIRVNRVATNTTTTWRQFLVSLNRAW